MHTVSPGCQPLPRGPRGLGPGTASPPTLAASPLPWTGSPSKDGRQGGSREACTGPGGLVGGPRALTASVLLAAGQLVGWTLGWAGPRGSRLRASETRMGFSATCSRQHLTNPLPFSLKSPSAPPSPLCASAWRGGTV